MENPAPLYEAWLFMSNLINPQERTFQLLNTAINIPWLRKWLRCRLLYTFPSDYQAPLSSIVNKYTDFRNWYKENAFPCIELVKK